MLENNRMNIMLSATFTSMTMPSCMRSETHLFRPMRPEDVSS